MNQQKPFTPPFKRRGPVTAVIAERKPSLPPGPHQESDEVILLLAEQLGETRHNPIVQIRKIVACIGLERALAFLMETNQIEANGGMLTADGSRRRTKGGVWFYLVRRKGGPEVRKLFAPRPGAQPKGQSPAQPHAGPPMKNLPQVQREAQQKETAH